MTTEEILGALDFLRAAEALKDVERSAHTSRGRVESTAEHTWRLCLMAMVFADGLEGIDLGRLLRICIVHDLGEALGGDIPAVVQAPGGGKAAQERADLRELCRPLPEARRAEILALWEEYDAAASRKRCWPRASTSWRRCCSTRRAATRRASITLSISTTAASRPRRIP